MSDEAQAPGALGNGEPDLWAPPERRTPTAGAARPGSQDAAPRPKIPLDKPGTESTAWAPPTSDTASSGPGAGAGAGPGAGASARANGSVHDLPTVISMPGADAPNPPGTGTPSAPSPQPWANPVAPSTAAALGNPFAPPGGAQAGGPAAYPSGNPFGAPAAPGEPVPPPPVAPDGPGQVPYGYGYPAQPYHLSAAGGPGYGWPGMPMAPSNGLGTAGLVLGIISAVGFCLWPVAIVVGVLGVIFGAIGRAKARRDEATNPGQALAGIICGAVGIVLGVAMGVLVIIGPGLFDDGAGSDSGTGEDGFSTSLVAER